jgi:hypothetical protein
VDINEKYEKLAVKIKCKGIEGSGCLFQPDSSNFTYVLTAKHCLEGTAPDIIQFEQQDIIIKRFEASESEPQLNVIKFYLHSELDIAIIVVDFIEEIPDVQIGFPFKNADVTIFGYPNHLGVCKSDDIRQGLTSRINRIRPRVFEMITRELPMTYNDNASDLIKGFSGCGSYIEKDDELTLIGIFKGLKSSTGGYQTICSIDINEANEMFKEIDLPELTSSCLLSFDSYCNDAFNCHDAEIAAILSEKVSNINDITPTLISNLLNQKLFLPYENKSLINPKIWAGWVLLLTYIYIDKEVRLNPTNFLNRLKNGENQNIKFYYSNFKLEDTVRHLITELYDELKHKDYVVINGSDQKGTLSLNENRIHKILKQIDSTILFKNKIMIDDPNFKIDISCVHIQKFAVKISEIEGEDIFTLYEKVRACVKAVFDDAI